MMKCSICCKGVSYEMSKEWVAIKNEKSIP